MANHLQRTGHMVPIANPVPITISRSAPKVSRTKSDQLDGVANKQPMIGHMMSLANPVLGTYKYLVLIAVKPIPLWLAKSFVNIHKNLVMDWPISDVASARYRIGLPV